MDLNEANFGIIWWHLLVPDNHQLSDIRVILNLKWAPKSFNSCHPSVSETRGNIFIIKSIREPSVWKPPGSNQYSTEMVCLLWGYTVYRVHSQYEVCFTLTWLSPTRGHSKHWGCRQQQGCFYCTNFKFHNFCLHSEGFLLLYMSAFWSYNKAVKVNWN